MTRTRNEFLSSVERLAAANMLNWMQRVDEERFLKHYQKSAELIAFNHDRGMSRATLVRIWGRKLVDAVIGEATTLSVKEPEKQGVNSHEQKTPRHRA
jgi:hypothetical protein